MIRINSIIERLKISPCTVKELPYKPTAHKLGIKNRGLLRKIHVNKRKCKMNGGPYGMLKTIYYLDGEEDEAVSKFVTENLEALKLTNFSGNNYLDSGLPKGLGSKIRKEFRNR